MCAPSAACELAASRAVGSFCSQPATEVAGYSPPPLRGSRWRTSPLRSICLARSIALAQDARVFLMAGWPKVRESRPAGQLSSPDPAGVFRDHGLAGLATPGLLEFGHVLQHAVYPITPGRMWIYADQHAGIFGAPLLAPYPAHAEEEALLGSIAINFFRGLAARILSDGFAQGGQRDAGSAVVGGIFAQRQFTVEFEVVYGDEVPVFVGDAAGA